jgi:8-oxo-dGTP pyrophosphatase MutT (NUDIX family)
MKVIYTGEEMPESFTKSIFLAGPTPRTADTESWRPDAIKILEDKGFDGVVFAPEGRDGVFKMDYDDQIEWEHKHLNVADCILFWVPRDLSLDKSDKMKMPAFTTNAEFGTWCDSGKIVFGCPPNVEERKNKYLKYYADYYHVDGGTTLTETIDAALDMLGEGDARIEGERYVPLFIWKTDSFQSWYLNQKKAGNRLDHAELLWNFRPRNKSFVYAWVLKVNVFVESENRNKINEFVLARTDISSVCLYYNKDPNATISTWEDIEVVLVKEFRSPANTPDGFIRELPGGSSPSKDEDPSEVAAHEVHEETGFHLKSDRLKTHGARQLAGTFSSHRSHLFSAELDEEEIKWFKSQDGIVHGNVEDSERTFIEVHNIKDLIENNLTDWTTLGQIFTVIL